MTDLERLVAEVQQEHRERMSERGRTRKVSRGTLEVDLEERMDAPFHGGENERICRYLQAIPKVRSAQKQAGRAGCNLFDYIDDDLSNLGSSGTRQSAGSQSARLPGKLRVRGVMPVNGISKNPGNAVPIAPWPVTSKEVKHAGNAEYPDRRTEEGHGEKGGGMPS